MAISISRSKQTEIRLGKSGWGTILFAAMCLCAWLIASAGLVCAQANLMEVSTVEGENAIDFGVLDSVPSESAYGNTADLRQVRLVVPNGIGQTFIISQTLQTEPRNQKGTRCPYNAIEFYVTLVSGNGSVRVVNRTGLQPGEQDLFISDPTGDPVTLLITYNLLMPEYQQAGRYYSTINYKIKTA
jgi:hypothetical protein